MVSIPKDKGFTSSSRKLSAVSFPTKTSAWIPAPTATTKSGSMLVRGGMPKYLSTSSLIMGERVEPPTMMTLSTSATAILESRRTRRHAFMVLLMKGSQIFLKSSRFNVPHQSLNFRSTVSLSLSSCLIRFA